MKPSNPMKLICVFLLIVCCGSGINAQVDEIKGASSSNSSKSSGKSDGGSIDDDGDGSGGIFFDLLFGGIAEAQSFKLRGDRQRYPSMVSLDVMFQGAVKPSSYYILWPRIRGNWGLFSTDFRMNYLIEEDAEGYKHIRTNDWQVIQLNLVTSRFFTFKLGTGFMQEAFNNKEMFSETAFLMFIHAPDQTKLLGFEYRFAKDFDTGANPRWELSAQYQHQLFSTGKFHGYASVGTVYQKYYNSIEVWGIQAGLVFRIF
jgi:hypothetical protein